ncbi:hypothetical protein [Limnoglobus roseus]|nr:hypothetical protein [Limnoglobus roseus]
MMPVAFSDLLVPRFGLRIFNQFRSFVIALQFVAYKLALVLVLATSGFSGGVVEDSAESTETLKELVCVSFTRPLPVTDTTAVRHPVIRTAAGVVTPGATTPSFPSRHLSHSLPNGLRAPLRC